MDWKHAFRWLFDSQHGASDRLIPRWLFLRALGLIYFSAFFSLIFQISGLIGPDGILPANAYLEAVTRAFGHVSRLWYAPSLFWISSNSPMMLAVCWIGIISSVVLIFNFWPRGTLVVCFLCFLTFVSAAQDFSSYQSDGMLLEAGFISLFFAPPGFRPGLGQTHPPSRASLFLLIWEWFRIYFESGVVKIVSGDPQWRHLTAMDEYYQNGPLPTWIGWYAQHLPHRFHVATAFATLSMELGLVWIVFLPRPWRISLFFVVTAWQIPVILTANYTFLNYLVLVLGVLILDDRFFSTFRLRFAVPPQACHSELVAAAQPREPVEQSAVDAPKRLYRRTKLIASTLLLTWIFYATTAELIWIFGRVPLPTSPVLALEPFRIANQYGLFAVMTRGRYEIEFQGSDDGQNWMAYRFRYKPQVLNQPPGIYAPYQP
ncbi:MAG: lipase maturation factor family protein, partial [Acidobacteriaceae bacterium]|nr:lipase maturation factor family protein [Acidobacteriaceae bacterium]